MNDIVDIQAVLDKYPDEKLKELILSTEDYKYVKFKIINEIYNTFSLCNDMMNNALKCLNFLKVNHINNEKYAEMFDDLKKLYNFALSKYEFAKECFAERQKTCNHNYVDDGWDSHHTYYICTKCGHEYSY